MPNGGSDNCGECGFNRANRGGAGIGHRVLCALRNQAIKNPFYTYCANYALHRPDQDPIPVGPILAGDDYGRRVPWKSSPDTEEIRRRHLQLLNLGPPFGLRPPSSMAAAFIWQLGEFREARAVPGLERIVARHKGGFADDAKKALAKIQNAIPEEHAGIETKPSNPARQLFLDVLDWLRDTYTSHSFFLQRDVAWTVQKRLLDRIGRWAPGYRVIHNRKVPKGTGRQFDLAVLDPSNTVVLALKFKFEPAEKLEPGKSPVVEWASVVSDIEAAQHAADDHHAKCAYSLFIDEGGYYKDRTPPRGSRWEDWDVGNGTRVAVLISEA